MVRPDAPRHPGTYLSLGGRPDRSSAGSSERVWVGRVLRWISPVCVPSRSPCCDRRPGEATGAAPDDRLFVRVDLDGDERDFWAPFETDGRWGTPLYYAAHLQELPHRLAHVVQAIASAPEGAILFHCGAGWDRTGLVAAVLLKAIGATEDAAVDDYLVSFANADAMTALHGRSFDVEERHGVLAAFGHTPDSSFREMYRQLDVDEWIRHAGVDEYRSPRRSLPARTCRLEPEWIPEDEAAESPRT